VLVLDGDIFDVPRITAIPRGGDLDEWAARPQAIAHPKPVSELRDSVSRIERRLRPQDRRLQDGVEAAGDRARPPLVECVAAGGRVLLLSWRERAPRTRTGVGAALRLSARGSGRDRRSVAVPMTFASGAGP
jgi:hypothetical protein